MGGGRTWIRERPELILSAEATKNHPRSLIIPVSCLSVWPCLMSPIGSSEPPHLAVPPFRSKFIYSKKYIHSKFLDFACLAHLNLQFERELKHPFAQFSAHIYQLNILLLNSHANKAHTCAMQIRSKQKKKPSNQS
jgi:hypothetical protein